MDAENKRGDANLPDLNPDLNRSAPKDVARDPEQGQRDSETQRSQSDASGESGTKSEEEQSATADPAENQPSSNRNRNIIAALATLIILGVIGYAILADGSDPVSNGEPTVVDELAGNDSAQTAVPGGVELGSLSVAGYACPQVSTPDEFCVEGQPIPLPGAVFTLEDGTEYALTEDMRTLDGTYALLNIPIGEYTLSTASIQGPDGTVLRTVIGPVTPVDNGWRVSNLDPNQPAIVQIIFVLDEGTPAAG